MTQKYPMTWLLFALTLSLLLLACSDRAGQEAATALPEPSPQVVVETVVLVETVVVMVTPTSEALPTMALTATTTATAVSPTSTPAPPPPTAVPQPLPTWTATAVSPTPLPELTIHYFRANVAAANPGQTIQLEWSTTGASQVTLSRLFDFRVAEWWEVASTGAQAYSVSPEQRTPLSFILTVGNAAGQSDSLGLTLPVNCPDPWFFAPSPEGCPAGPARYSSGAEQRFQNGYMLWEQAERRIYILFHDGAIRWNIVSDTWVEGEPICQIEPVPPGLLHPARGFGKVWCSDPALRDRLGWAMSGETGGFQTAVQATAKVRYNEIYIRAADGMVWKLLPERSGWEKISVQSP